jgi:lysyl-tRNA synthetase class II
MHKFIKTLVVLSIIIFSLPATARAEEVTKINDLIENAKDLDGLEVVIQGEAIGESMRRGEYSWININDGSNAIGVWLSSAEIDKIKYYGNYKNIGDIVKIAGNFYRACKEHGGEADFHATSLEVVESGHPVNIAVSIPKSITAAILSILALFLSVVFLKVKARR